MYLPGHRSKQVLAPSTDVTDPKQLAIQTHNHDPKQRELEQYIQQGAWSNVGTDETPLRHHLENQRSWWNRVLRRSLSRRGAGVRLLPRSTGLPGLLPLLP